MLNWPSSSMVIIFNHFFYLTLDIAT